MFGEKKKNNVLVFLITGIFFLALVVTYKVVFYARYLNLNTDNVVFEWTGGEQEVLVYTNANCWVVEDEEYVNWASFQKKGNSLQITVYQNNDKTERSSYIKIRSGLIEGIGNKWTSLKVIQDGKQATYINSSARSVSFSEQGGSESLQINTDGDEWIVVDCPNWVSKKVSGNTLVLSAFDNNSTPRNGIIRVQSDERMIEIEVFQQGSLVYTVHGVSFTMKSVEGGTFIMGNNKSEWDDEKPSHEVMVNSFYMGETEVTIALWKAVMGGGYHRSSIVIILLIVIKSCRLKLIGLNAKSLFKS